VRLALIVSSIAMVAFWVLVLSGSDARGLIVALFLIGLPSALVPVYDYWRAHRGRR
jgi:hypothetical protein